MVLDQNVAMAGGGSKNPMRKMLEIEALLLGGTTS